MKKKYLILGLALLFMLPTSTNVAAAETNQQLTPGIKLTKQSTTISKQKQSVNILDVNLSDPYTTVNFGVSDPITKLNPVTTLAKLHTRDKHHVVGAINASFFHMDNGNPTYLLATKNKINNLGAVSGADTGYMYTPAAFGIDKNGKAIIDKFKLKISISHSNKTYELTDFNRQRNPNESILFTKSFRYSNTRTNATGLEVVVTGLDKNLDPGATFGEKITGKVTSIRPYGRTSSATIPKNGFVISAHGSKVEQIRALKVGDPISITVDIEDKWKGSEFMLASGPLLVQGGKVNMSINPTSPRATQREPRSAVAVDKTGKRVFLVTVDGRQKNHSAGMTLKEFSNYLLSKGAYQAINLDGGGSTTMAARLPGNRYATLINKPSDGRQRSVSAILEAISTAPYGDAVSFSAASSAGGKLAIGGSTTFTISNALDSYNNLLTVNYDKVSYTVEGGIGRVEGNKFIAEKDGTGSVTVKYGKAQKKIPITVTAPAKITIEPSSIKIGINQTQNLSVKAFDSSGKELKISQSNIKWSTKGNVGTFSSNGAFKAASAPASGSIIAQHGTKKVEIPVSVTNKPTLLDGFESAAKWKADSVRAKTSIGLMKDGTQKDGTGYLRLNYDFTNQKGTVASYAVAASRIKMDGMPHSIGLWVYGDGNNHWIRGRLYDAAGKEVIVNFTEEGGQNWIGWKFVQATIPKNVKYPVSFERIYVAETKDTNKNKGTIYFDKLQAIYHTPYTENYFDTSKATSTVSTEKKWTVAFNIELDEKSVSGKSIFVEDVRGNRLPATVKLAADKKSVIVEAPKDGYAKNTAYRLVISRGVKSTEGAPMKKDYYVLFKTN